MISYGGIHQVDSIVEFCLLNPKLHLHANSIHTLLLAMNRPPLLIQPGLTPVSSSSLLTWAINSLIRIVSVSLGRRLHTRPAVCQVVPLIMQKVFRLSPSKWLLSICKYLIYSTFPILLIGRKIFARSLWKILLWNQSLIWKENPRETTKTTWLFFSFFIAVQLEHRERDTNQILGYHERNSILYKISSI